MQARIQRRQAIVLALAAALATSGAWGDIFRWDNQQVIAGTAGITPAPGVDLGNWNTSGHVLEYADLRNVDLSYSNFANSDLQSAAFAWSTLTAANFAGADLVGANFVTVPTEPVVVPGQPNAPVTLQFYRIGGVDLTDANFSGADLSSASFQNATLAGANFAGATITSSNLADVHGFSAGQLYATASYAVGNLQGVNLGNDTLAGWSFAGQNLTNASFSYVAYYTVIDPIFPFQSISESSTVASTVTNADFSGAVIAGVDFNGVTSLTPSQLYSTASYASHDLHGVELSGLNLTAWNFAQQNLTSASFAYSNLTAANFAAAGLASSDFTRSSVSAANFAEADLAGALFTGSIARDANFAGADLSGAVFSPLIYLGASSSMAGLARAGPADQVNVAGLILQFWTPADLSDANFVGANLTGSRLGGATLTCTNFSDADLRGANGFVPDSSTITSNTILPNGAIQGLHLSVGEMLVVRNSAIPVVVETGAVVDSGGTLRFLISGDWTSTVGFADGVTPMLGGTLDLEFAPGVDPTTLVGDSFHLFAWNGAMDGTDEFGLVSSGEGVTWDLSDLYTMGVITLAAAPAGDFSPVPEAGTLGMFLGAAMLVRRGRRVR